MAIQMIPEGTASQQASAAAHFANRSEWKFVRIDGVRYAVIESANTGSVYRVRADGKGCGCRYYLLGNEICSHMISVRLFNEHSAEIERQHQAALQAWLDDMAPVVAPTPARKPYEAVFAARCMRLGCRSMATAESDYCSADELTDAF